MERTKFGKYMKGINICKKPKEVIALTKRIIVKLRNKYTNKGNKRG